MMGLSSNFRGTNYVRLIFMVIDKRTIKKNGMVLPQKHKIGKISQKLSFSNTFPFSLTQFTLEHSIR